MTSILFVNRTGRVSGAEAVLLRLIEAAVQRGDRVRLVSPPGRLVERLSDGVDHTEIDEFDLAGLTAGVEGAFNLANRQSIDVSTERAGDRVLLHVRWSR